MLLLDRNVPDGFKRLTHIMYIIAKNTAVCLTAMVEFASPIKDHVPNRVYIFVITL